MSPCASFLFAGLFGLPQCFLSLGRLSLLPFCGENRENSHEHAKTAVEALPAFDKYAKTAVYGFPAFHKHTKITVYGLPAFHKGAKTSVYGFPAEKLH